MSNYIVATTKQWNIEAFELNKRRLEGNWKLITSPEELTIENLLELKPRYIFFPHWSWIVPSEIINEYDCVCFHMTDVPFGRGGSPLQNLINNGVRETKISALKMIEEVDAGPVYSKKDFDISKGSAQEIFCKFSTEIYEMIEFIYKNEPTPVEQEGRPVYFKRRKVEESEIHDQIEFEKIYDHIRMLDAETYPKACITMKNLVFEFSEIEEIEDEFVASVRIRRNHDNKN